MPTKFQISQRIHSRREMLIAYLMRHFEPGKFITIEEICANVTDCVVVGGDEDVRWIPFYQLNKNPYIHDKCVTLGADIRAINWGALSNNHFIIIRNSSGDVKLCESNEEFENWRKKELEPIERKCKYLNSLKSKANADGTIPLFEFAGDTVVSNDDPISAYPSND